MKNMLLMVMLLVTSTVYADDDAAVNTTPTLSVEQKSSAISFMKDIIKKAVDNILTAKVAKSEKEANFKKIFMSSLDKEYVAKVVLGKTWKNATPDEQRAFLKAFEDLVVANWSSMFDKYSGQIITTNEANAVASKAGNQSEVLSTVVSADNPNAQPVYIAWRLKFENAEYKIIDIAVEGVSMAMNYQSEYREIVSQAQEAGKSPMTELLTKIKEKTDSYKNKKA
jgi:phospholipid transport system substrate-binding protein